MTTTAITIGIIGTAGRKDDAARLDARCYATMVEAATEIVAQMRGGREVRLVSGGAAGADHVAVALVVAGLVPATNLTLHLPARLGADGRFEEAVRDGSTANHYHRQFARRCGIDGAGELARVVADGATVTVSNGFFARNALVARDARDVLLAFTFGSAEPWKPLAHAAGTNAAEAGLKDGGTAHTWDRSRARVKIHVCLA